MSDFLHPQDSFLQKVIHIIEAHLGEEEFGVSELSTALNMSRSNLLRKVKKLTGVSVSVYIRKVRLHHAKSLLKDEILTVSEISFKVGFSSTSYFTKCFREEFGYTPGNQKHQKAELNNSDYRSVNKLKWIIPVFLIAITTILVFKFYQKEEATTKAAKTIAVLPFNNNSADSSNVYIINGVVDAILDNLQKIEELQVTSRTTAERYRGASKTIQEIARELEVSYFVEGSGQKIGDRIVLSVQLIDGEQDRQIWSNRFERKLEDIFQLQSEISKTIANEIEVRISSKAQRLIDKIPTKNMVAYDLFLKGQDLTNHADETEELEQAVHYFEEAITEDPYFAQPHAYIAICYYYMDLFQADQQYAEKINSYADKAILLDPELGESLIAKALFYMQDQQYELAIEFFEKVLRLNPNSGWVHNFLSSIYANYIPNTEKYLAHAIRGIKMAVSDQDSIEASFSYLHLSNALIQTGFIEEAEKYIRKSLDYNSSNFFSQYLHVYIKQAQNLDLERAKNELKEILQKDTTRLEIIQELAKVCYTMKNYQEAWIYYEKLLTIKDALKLDIYKEESIKIAFTLQQLNKDEKANELIGSFKEFLDSDNSIYVDLNASSYHVVNGDLDQGIKHLKAFTKQKDFFYWIILFLEKDPIIQRMSGHKDYQQTIDQIKSNFWEQHHEIRKVLLREGVI